MIYFFMMNFNYGQNMEVIVIKFLFCILLNILIVRLFLFEIKCILQKNIFVDNFIFEK